jgi:hypothetical protein
MGVLTQIIISVERTIANVASIIFHSIGMLISMISVSLANLLTMRPSGVVSKKDMGARRIQRNMSL